MHTGFNEQIDYYELENIMYNFSESLSLMVEHDSLGFSIDLFLYSIIKIVVRLINIYIIYKLLNVLYINHKLTN